MAGLLLAEVGRRRDTSLLGQECGVTHRHGTCLCARLEAAPPLTPPGVRLRAGAACRTQPLLSTAVPGAEKRPGGCLEEDTSLVIYSHVVWCLGAFFQSIPGTLGEGERITATQGGLGSSQEASLREAF